jgi:hypothetical protein
MAIVFDCPHCKTNYRLKDDLAGKTATCKNPNCRKVIPIPKAKAVVAAAKPVDVDALAAQMFSDEPAAAAAKVVEEMITVTCTGCDHSWQVEASKEGKNVLCPECRKPTRVPMRKKEEKADWRTGQAGRPSMAKVETGLDVQGAFATNQAGAISQQTAREIVKDREAQEEPEVKRKRLIKRLVLAVVLIGVAGAGGYFAFKKRGEAQAEGKMGDAVKEINDAKLDARFQALILRASGEHRARTATNAEEIKAAFMDLQTAKNRASKISPVPKSANCDHDGTLAEIAITMVELLGNAEQVESGERMAAKDVVKEVRVTLEAISDSELRADAVRAITRKCADKNQLNVVQDIARQLPNGNEMLGQVGLELLRMDRDKYRDDVQKLIASVVASPTGDATSIKTLRLFIPKQPGKKDGEAAAFSYIASAEDKALKGQLADVPKGLGAAKPEERIRALAAAAQAVIDKNPNEAASWLETAANEAKTAKALSSPWVGVRICRLLAKAGKHDAAEALAASSAMADEEAKSWARLEILRARLAQAQKQKADDAWLDLIGDATKLGAAAKAREDIARHNAAGGHDYPAMANWEKGKVKPFGVAGTILGKGDSN